ncbi:hypothetical protein [Embleya sp. NPDC050493]|uniref:hypothetical protein n=1 Tax=Embleya sp. NPDC050493 TaxID=3363989 RepID=UPI003787A929
MDINVGAVVFASFRMIGGKPEQSWGLRMKLPAGDGLAARSRQPRVERGLPAASVAGAFNGRAVASDATVVTMAKGLRADAVQNRHRVTNVDTDGGQQNGRQCGTPSRSPDVLLPSLGMQPPPIGGGLSERHHRLV